MLALIFIPAGTFRYWQGWASLGVFVGCSCAYTMWLTKYDPALLKRRTEIGISHEKEFAQKVIVALLYAACIVLVVLPPLDFRFGWSFMPWQISIAGDALVALSFYIFYLVSKVNTYAAANVRVEEGQRGYFIRRIRLCSSSDVLCRSVSFCRRAACSRVMVDVALLPGVYTASRSPYFERRRTPRAGFARLRRLCAQCPIPFGSWCLVGQPSSQPRDPTAICSAALERPLSSLDDRIGVDAIGGVEIGNIARLAEMVDAERRDALAAHRAEPGQRRRMAVGHRD